LTNRDSWKEYFSNEMQTKAKIEADLEQEGLRRLYLSFKQEEDYNKR
jgi:hypothetical protein